MRTSHSVASTRIRRFRRDGLIFPVHDSGPGNGAPVVLLHGFPLDHRCWDATVPILHRAGLRTLAPDQRGYAQDNAPSSRRAYLLPDLADDVLALLDEAQISSAHLVGHGWGGALAWHLAGTSQRIRSVTILSTPHPGALTWSARRRGRAPSGVSTVFVQLPYLPERMLARRLPGRVKGGAGLSAQRAQSHLAAYEGPADLTGPLNWYRAARLYRGPTPDARVPTTYLWGNHDAACHRATAQRTARYVRGDYRFIELAGGHWLPETHPVAVAGEVEHQVRSVDPM